MKNVLAPKGSEIVLRHDGKEIACDLYSPEGRELMAALWLKVSAHNRRVYEPRWLGTPIIQLSEDIVMMQELIWKLRPDVIVETGIAHGGSLVLSASILQLIGAGKVIGVDVDIRKHNREAIDAHPLRHRMELIEGSSIDPAVVAQVRQKVGDAKCVLVVLDSNHSAVHVAAELDAYASLVTVDSYIVAMDGAQAYVGDIPMARPGWGEDHPLVAIRAFLLKNPEFVVDPYYERLDISSSPEGFLRRIRATDESRT